VADERPWKQGTAVSPAVADRHDSAKADERPTLERSPSVLEIYCTAISQHGKYGGEMEVRALAELLDCRIVIYQRSKPQTDSDLPDGLQQRAEFFPNMSVDSLKAAGAAGGGNVEAAAEQILCGSIDTEQPVADLTQSAMDFSMLISHGAGAREYNLVYSRDEGVAAETGRAEACGHYEILHPKPPGAFERAPVQRDGNCLFVALLRLHEPERYGSPRIHYDDDGVPLLDDDRRLVTDAQYELRQRVADYIRGQPESLGMFFDETTLNAVV